LMFSRSSSIRTAWFNTSDPASVSPVRCRPWRTKTGNPSSSSSSLIWLLIPGCEVCRAWAAAVTLIPWYLADPAAKIAWQSMLATHEPVSLPYPTQVNIAMSIVLHVVYAVMSIGALRRRVGELARVSSDNELAVEIAATRRLLVGYGAFAGWYFLTFLAFVVWWHQAPVIDWIWLAGLGLLVQAQGVLSLRRPRSLAARLAEASSPATEGPDPRSLPYAKSRLTDAQLKSGAADLVRYLERERPFLDGTLKLADVAAALNASPHRVSQIISTGLGTNFLQLINRYRVEEARRLLADPERASLTILAAGYDAGFNNKTSFNKTFREFVGMTPSAFRRHAMEEASHARASNVRDEVPSWRHRERKLTRTGPGSRSVGLTLR